MTWSRAWRLGSALLAAGAATGLAMANVIGADGRRLAPSADNDLISAVGLVVCERLVDGRRHFGRGTGTLVGSRTTVLTVAHVLASNPARSSAVVHFDPVSDCTFRQYSATGELRLEVAFTYAVFGEFRRDSGLPNQDWAVLRLAEPLPASSTPLGFAATALDDLDRASRIPIAAVAFHADAREAGARGATGAARDLGDLGDLGDRSDRGDLGDFREPRDFRDDRSRRRAPLKSEGRLFAVDYVGLTRLAHTADMGRMSSGAALVRRAEDGRAVVVGLHRSAANLGEFNLGVPIAAELHATLRSFAYGDVSVPATRLAAIPGR